LDVHNTFYQSLKVLFELICFIAARR